MKADQTKALEMFTKGEGGFRDRDLYVFCSNLADGKIVALGNPNIAKQCSALICVTLKDATGKMYGPDLYAGMQNRKASLPKLDPICFRDRAPTRHRFRRLASSPRRRPILAAASAITSRVLNAHIKARPVDVCRKAY